MSKTILKGENNGVTSAVADPNGTVVLTGKHDCESAHPLNLQSINTHEEAIRALAYLK